MSLAESRFGVLESPKANIIFKLDGTSQIEHDVDIMPGEEASTGTFRARLEPGSGPRLRRGPGARSRDSRRKP